MRFIGESHPSAPSFSPGTVRFPVFTGYVPDLQG